MVTREPSGSNFKMSFIQCAACGGVVGVTDFFDTGTQIKKVLSAIENLSHGVGRLGRALKIQTGL